MLFAFLLLASSSITIPSDQDAFNWASRQREVAVDALFPQVHTQVPPECEWVVSVRIRPAFQGERSIEITKAWDGAISAVVSSVKGAPIAEQLARLHLRRRAAPLAQLLADIPVRREVYRVDECAALRLLVEALGRMNLPGILPSDLQMDATHYEITSRTRTNAVTIQIGGSAPQALAVWLLQVERLIDTGCAAD